MIVTYTVYIHETDKEADRSSTLGLFWKHVEVEKLRVRL